MSTLDENNYPERQETGSGNEVLDPESKGSGSRNWVLEPDL